MTSKTTSRRTSSREVQARTTSGRFFSRWFHKRQSQDIINYFVYPAYEQVARVGNPAVYVHVKRDNTLSCAVLLAPHEVSTASCVLSLKPLNLASSRLGRWLTVVMALVRWATGKRSTNRLPKLSLITIAACIVVI